MDAIITSLLDVDFYKFTMGQLVFHKHPSVAVRYAFVDRSRRPIAKVVPESRLREELDHAATIGLNDSELHYLRGTNEYGDRMFKEDFLDFLRALRLPPYDLRTDGAGGYVIEFAGGRRALPCRVQAKGALADAADKHSPRRLEGVPFRPLTGGL